MLPGRRIKFLKILMLAVYTMGVYAVAKLRGKLSV